MTLSAILVGGCFAEIALLLTLMDPFDAICRAYVPRGLPLCFYVDDIAMHFVGQFAEVAAALTGCINDTIDMLEGQLCMVASRRQQWASTAKAKTIAFASSHRLASRLHTPMRRMGIVIDLRAKHLGINFRPGAKTRGGGARHGRWAASAARRARTVKLGATHAQTGILSASDPGSQELTARRAVNDRPFIFPMVLPAARLICRSVERFGPASEAP